MKQQLFLVRHAEIGPEYMERYIGSTDASLTVEGVRQCQRLSHDLQSALPERGVQAWISPSKRCQETWAALQLTVPFKTQPELREIDFGQWENQNFSGILASSPELVKQWAEFDATFCFPEGESLSDFLGRMQKIRKQILSTQDTVVLITHGGVIATLLCLFLGLSPAQYLAFRIHRSSFSTLDLFENGNGVLTGLNHGHSVVEATWRKSV